MTAMVCCWLRGRQILSDGVSRVLVDGGEVLCYVLCLTFAQCSHSALVFRLETWLNLIKWNDCMLQHLLRVGGDRT